MVVRIAKLEPQETPPFKVSRRGNADLSTALVQINVPGDVAGRDDVMVLITLQEVGFLSGNDVVGSLVVPLKELMEQGCISGKKKLRKKLDQISSGRGGGMEDEEEDGGDSGSSAKVEIRWIGNFT
jgi:hypothetical protein